MLTLDAGTVCGAGRTVRRMKLPRLQTLDLYLDGSTLEVFVNEGEAVLTTRLFGRDDTVAAEPFAGTLEFYTMNAFVLEDADADPVS